MSVLTLRGIYGVLSLLTAAALFTAVGLTACWLPARRAAGVDPVTALREE